jgi:hypothetical protein
MNTPSVAPDLSSTHAPPVGFAPGARVTGIAMRKWRGAAAIALMILAVVLSSFLAGTCFARRVAVTTTTPPKSQGSRPTLNARSIVVARLLILALRQRGTSVLAQLPQASDQDLQHVTTGTDEVVQLEGELRDVQFDDGLFMGTIVSPKTGVTYFVTPIATEGIANHVHRRFRGVPIPIHGEGPVAESDVIVVGAFDVP